MSEFNNLKKYLKLNPEDLNPKTKAELERPLYSQQARESVFGEGVGIPLLERFPKNAYASPEYADYDLYDPNEEDRLIKEANAYYEKTHNLDGKNNLLPIIHTLSGPSTFSSSLGSIPHWDEGNTPMDMEKKHEIRTGEKLPIKQIEEDWLKSAIASGEPLSNLFDNKNYLDSSINGKKTYAHDPIAKRIYHNEKQFKKLFKYLKK